tara:strand:+ start:12 stop:293 length:282 start_codon:yes stop_codon:yes gene_type:complete
MKDNTNIYVKAKSIKDFESLNVIKRELEEKIILIIKIKPSLNKNIKELKKIIDDLNEYVSLIGGDIGKLEKNTIIVTSQGIRIWRSNNINKFL